MIFLVGAFTLQDHIARKTILHSETELRFVEHILFGSKVNQNCLGQQLLLVLVFRYGWHTKAFRNLS